MKEITEQNIFKKETKKRVYFKLNEDPKIRKELEEKVIIDLFENTFGENVIYKKVENNLKEKIYNKIPYEVIQKTLGDKKLSDFKNVYICYNKSDKFLYVYWFEGFYYYEPKQKGNSIYTKWYNDGRPKRIKINKKIFFSFTN